MSRILDGLTPKRVFYYFEEISKIPRGSKNEQAISDYLYAFGQNLGFEVFQDESLNIVIKKPATKGYENAPTVLIQGHMDMVCEKNSNTVHDFEKDPLKLVVSGDDISADGTTLGADNGIAVAMALALLESKDMSHPALEVLLTTDEEMGMSGAAKVDGSIFNSRILINLDSEGEGELTAGCSGGGRIHYYVPIIRQAPAFKRAYKITVKGLKGGHSGVDIHLERGNSNVILARILNQIIDFSELQSINGGAKDNAIPREACAVILCRDVDRVNSIVETHAMKIKSELAVTDSGMVVDFEPDNKAFDSVFSKETFSKIISSLLLIPNGPKVKSTKIDLVILSNNVGVVTTTDTHVAILTAPRSSVKSLLDFQLDQVQLLADAMGCDMQIKAIYPGWEYRKESYIRDLTIKVYKDITSKDMHVAAIHAGLECGLLMEKIEGLDAVSFGPNMYDIHTPDERISISSVERCYHLLCELLKHII